MTKERIEEIGKFLNYRMVIHRNVEHNSTWTTEEKMIVDLYDNYLNLLLEYGKQKEIIDKAIDKLYCYGEVLDPEFQKEMLEILEGDNDEKREENND